MFDRLSALPWMLGAIIITSCFHEAGHAWAAWRLGDRRPYIAERKKFWSPKHISLWFTVVIPAILIYYTGLTIGGAKPVMVSTRAVTPRRMILVAIAGPMGNVFVGVLGLLLIAGLLHAGVLFDTGRMIRADDHYGYLMYGVGLSFFLGLLNLMPIPPLDGSRVAAAFLPEPWRSRYLSLGAPCAIGMFVLFVVVAEYWPEKLSFMHRFLGQTVPSWTRHILAWIQS